MKTEGLKEEMPGGVCCASIQYGCDACQHGNGTEFNNGCSINPMTTVMLILSGRRSCPFRNMTKMQIEEWLKEKKE